MSSKVAWYIARAGGLTAWGLLTATVVLGLLTAAQFPGLRTRTAALARLHRRVSEFTMVFVVVHILGLVADATVHFGGAEIFVPFASSWRPWAVTFGVVGMWTLLAVLATSLMRNRLPRRVWHAVHVSSYVTWIAVSAHLVGAGTDAFSRVVEAMNVGAVVAVAALAVLALVRYERRSSQLVSRRAGRSMPGANESANRSMAEASSAIRVSSARS